MIQPRLANAAVVALALAWLPGQTTAGALRAWLCLGALPCLVLWQGGMRGGLSWLLLAATALVAGTSTAVWLAAWQLGWWAALLLGRHAPARHSAIALAGALAALPGWFNPNGFFGNPDYLAAFVALCVPSIWVLLRQDRRWSLAGVAVMGALWRADSLGAWAALAAVAVIALLIHRRWAAVVLLGALSIAGVFARASIATHLEGRAHLAEVTLRVARSAPIVGVGAGRVHTAFLEQQARTLDDSQLWTNAHHAHAEPLQALAEQGLIGLVLLCLPILLAARQRPWTAHHATVGVGVILGCVTLPLYMPGACFLIAHGLGAAWGPTEPSDRRWRWPARALGIGLLLIATSRLMTDRMLARADRTTDAALAETAAQWSLTPARALRVAAAHQPASAHALGLADAANTIDLSVEGVMLSGRIRHQLGDLDGAATAFRRATRLHRWLFAGWFNLSRTLEDQGDRNGARRAAIRARSLRPSDPRLRHLPP